MTYINSKKNIKKVHSYNFIQNKKNETTLQHKRDYIGSILLEEEGVKNRRNMN